MSNRHRPSHSLSERTESKVVLHTNEPERWVRDRGAINKNNRERQPPGNPSLYCLGRMHEKKFKKKRKDKITKKNKTKNTLFLTSTKITSGRQPWNASYLPAPSRGK